MLGNKTQFKRSHSWISNYINLEGPHNLNRWMDIIGFSNTRSITRYELWRKKGYLEPKTNLPERMKQLGWVGGGLK